MKIFLLGLLLFSNITLGSHLPANLEVPSNIQSFSVPNFPTVNFYNLAKRTTLTIASTVLISASLVLPAIASGKPAGTGTSDGSSGGGSDADRAPQCDNWGCPYTGDSVDTGTKSLLFKFLSKQTLQAPLF